jgi:hypothetical protein
MVPLRGGVADPGRGLAGLEAGPGRWEEGDGTGQNEQSPSHVQ